jgi:hypothetical protein
VLGVPLIVAHERASNERPDDVSAGIDIALLDLGAARLAREQACDPLGIGFDVVGMRDVANGLFEQLLGRIASVV